MGDIAREKGQDPFEAIVEIVAADDLRTVLWPQPGADGPEDWALRRKVWDHPDVVLGGSDAGAHLDRMLGSAYPTQFLADSLRGKQLVPVEEAVRLMTDVPARLFGLRDRGRVAQGYHADLVVLDPATVGAGPVRTVYDLPGNAKRLLADALGVVRVLVNGKVTVEDGVPVGSVPGTVLRAGRTRPAPTRAPCETAARRAAAPRALRARTPVLAGRPGPTIDGVTGPAGNRSRPARPPTEPRSVRWTPP